MFRAVKRRTQIERLYSSLAEDRVALDQMISQKLLSSIDILTVAQSKEFSNLNSFAQQLISDLVEQRKIQEVNNATLAGKLDSVRSDVQQCFSEVDRMMMRKKVLESLFFPEIDQRQSEIKEPAPNTLDWLFGPTSEAVSTTSGESEWYTESDSDSEQGSGNDSAWESDTESSDEGRSQPPWSNFRQWLREDTSMYWISGKAGSGKSTLMAHIVNDRRTLHDLNIWREGNELRVLSFFFWRAGTRLQNSVLGLLRSLLYQLCRLNPFIVDSILARLSSPVGMIPVWTERSLLDHVTKAIQSSTGFRFCVFIDGLDEYTGPYDDLVDHIKLLQESGNLKVCASSRPELELVNRLWGLKRLRLQDLNRGDIEHFVRGSLAKTQLNQQECTDLAEEIVERAEGVFLWASLTTQSLLKGIMAGDDGEIIKKRLDSLPGDMEQLFSRMLMDVDVVYRESLALYIQLEMFKHEFGYFALSIPIIATLQLEKRINSYEEFIDECKNTELRIITRSAGLLEVNEIYIHGIRDSEVEWQMSTTNFISDKPHFTLVADGPDRRRCAQNEPYPAMLRYERHSTDWIHRSAFEFFSSLSEKVLFESGLSREALLRKISESHISYLLAAPSYVVNNYRSITVSRLYKFLNFISKWYDQYPTMASALLDNLFYLFKQFVVDELGGVDSEHWFNPDSDDLTAETIFWSQCALHYNWPYIVSRLSCISKRMTDSSLIAHLLAILMAPFPWLSARSKDSRDLPQVIHNLLEALPVQRLESVQTAAYKCISLAHESNLQPFFFHSLFVCASWREGIRNGCMMTMTRIIYIIGRLFTIDPSSPSFRDRFLPLISNKKFSTLLDITDLYVALDFGLRRITVQISVKAWARFYFLIFPAKEKGEVYDNDCIGRFLSASQDPKAVKILCVPSYKKRQTSTPVWKTTYTSWIPIAELKDSQFISLHLSITAMVQLLSLFTCVESSDTIKYRMIPNTLKQREEVCGLLLREMKSAEQGLDGGQQLIAAACLRAGLLDPDIETD
ncbi:hypothetical protein F4679DRAFT_89292 [Xylaria curta]|nr:hypothetical protein F4679DRAFT_89292 [Xylaria curta]